MCRADFSCENFPRNQIFLVTVEALLVTTLVSDHLQLQPERFILLVLCRLLSPNLHHRFQFETKPSNLHSVVHKKIQFCGNVSRVILEF